MGCAAEIVVVGEGHLAAELAWLGRARIEFLESRWSRFIPTSDIARLNAAAGAPIAVDPSTVTLVRMMGAGSLFTDGAYDPTLLGSIVGVESGSWSGHTNSGSHCAAPVRAGGRWYDDVAVDPRAAVVQLPDGLLLDPGGIGKGLAADLVAAELTDGGASGVLVNVGGDLRVTGSPPTGSSWRIGIGRPSGDGELGQLAVGAGGVATSGILRRRWTTADGETAHHLIDPATGSWVRPHHGAIETVQATVVAVTAAWAEVTVKALMVKGAALELPRLGRLGVPACAIGADGAVAGNDSWQLISTGFGPSAARVAS